MSQHLFLTGYRGTGKSSVGRRLAEHLGVPLIDLDERVVRLAGQTIREIFAAGGEEAFRELESEALLAVIREPRSVVALGGGAVLRAENREVIRGAGGCVWLDADADTLTQRIAGDAASSGQRPSLTGLPARDEVVSLLEQRRPLYDQVADHRIETAGKSVEAVAGEVLQRLRLTDPI